MANDTNDQRNRDLAIAGGAAGVGSALGIAENPLIRHLSRGDSRDMAEEAVHAARDANEGLLDRLQKLSPVPVTAGEADSYYHPSTRSIEIGAYHKGVPSVLAHEIGHAKIDESRFGRLAQSIIPTKAYNKIVAPLSGVAAGYGIDNPYAGAALAAGVPLLLHAPNLGSEAAASVKGMRMLRSAGASPEVMEHAGKGLAKAFGTYAATTGATAGRGLAGWGAGRLGRTLLDGDGSDESSVTPKTAEYHTNPFVMLKTAAEKLAKTRAQKEWQKAQEVIAGGTAPAAAQQSAQEYQDQIARAYGQLELRPRHLRDISIGGEEAAVDLMMGQAPGGKKVDDTGYLARKLYKPDSGLHRGEVTRQVLQMKQDITDKAMSDPKTRQHMVGMAGFQEIPGAHPGDTSHFVSYHQYVPGVRHFLDKNPHAEDQMEELHRNLIRPMSQQHGMGIEDVVSRASNNRFTVNPGNIAAVEEGGRTVPKVMDFLPARQFTPTGSVHAPTKGFEAWNIAKNLLKPQNLLKVLTEDPEYVEAHPEVMGYTKFRGKGHTVEDVRRAVFQGRTGRAVQQEAPGAIRTIGRTMAQHPYATGAAALGTLGAIGAGGYALRDRMRADNDEGVPKAASAFCDEMLKLFTW